MHAVNTQDYDLYKGTEDSYPGGDDYGGHLEAGKRYSEDNGASPMRNTEGYDGGVSTLMMRQQPWSMA